MKSHISEQNNKILFDWFSMTTSISDTSDIIDLLGLKSCPFTDVPGAKGWKKRLYFSGISIHYEGHDGLIWLEMSGQGCRTFETLGHGDFNTLFRFVLDNPKEVNITRLDVAYDDYKYYLDIDHIASDTLNGRFIAKTRHWNVDISDTGMCITHGSRNSSVLIRIYDKAAERNRKDEIEHWVRCEMQLRRNRANEFIRLLICENEVIDDLYFAVLNHYLRFVEPSEDSNKSRWDTAAHWVKFASSRTDKAVSLFVKPGLDYNILKLRHYVVDMAGGACYTYIKMVGVNKFFEECTKQHIATLNPKYKQLLGEYDEFIKHSNKKSEDLKSEDLKNDSIGSI